MNWPVAAVVSYYSTTLKFMELIWTIRSQMFVKAAYVARLLISYINGTENTWNED